MKQQTIILLTVIAVQVAAFAYVGWLLTRAYKVRLRQRHRNNGLRDQEQLLQHLIDRLDHELASLEPEPLADTPFVEPTRDNLLQLRRAMLAVELNALQGNPHPEQLEHRQLEGFKHLVEQFHQGAAKRRLTDERDYLRLLEEERKHLRSLRHRLVGDQPTTLNTKDKKAAAIELRQQFLDTEVRLEKRRLEGGSDNSRHLQPYVSLINELLKSAFQVPQGNLNEMVDNSYQKEISFYQERIRRLESFRSLYLELVEKLKTANPAQAEKELEHFLAQARHFEQGINEELDHYRTICVALKDKNRKLTQEVNRYSHDIMEQEVYLKKTVSKFTQDIKQLLSTIHMLEDDNRKLRLELQEMADPDYSRGLSEEVNQYKRLLEEREKELDNLREEYNALENTLARIGQSL